MKIIYDDIPKYCPVCGKEIIFTESNVLSFIAGKQKTCSTCNTKFEHANHQVNLSFSILNSHFLRIAKVKAPGSCRKCNNLGYYIKPEPNFFKSKLNDTIIKQIFPFCNKTKMECDFTMLEICQDIGE